MSATKVPKSYGSTQGMKPRAFAAFEEIAKQPVAPTASRESAGPRAVSSGPSATKVPASYGSTMGMKPGAFGAMKRIAGQTVKGADKSWLRRERPAKEKEEDEKSDEKFIAAAKKRFDQVVDAEAEIRKASLEDLRFYAGDQWDDAIKRQRQMDGRPCLTINRLPAFVRNVTNAQRQNRTSVQVNPVDDGGDKDTAEILQGLIRHIEYDSAADAAYDTAAWGAATFGFGYYRVMTEFADEMSFDQDIKIKRIRNPFTVYLDPEAKEPDYSDAEFGFIIATLSRDQYKAKYPDSELSKMEDWQSVGDTNTDWIAEDTCRVAEYFWREREDEEIALLNDGTVVPVWQLPDQLPADVEVVKRRTTQVCTVKWAKINGVEVLDETDWAGKWIPIVKVVGDELDIDGKLVLKGIVRDTRDPQQQFNYMKSAATEAIALAPKAPFVGAEGQFAGREREWQQANVKNHAFLQYKPIAISGVSVPPPQRNTAEPAIQAITIAMQESTDDLKSVTGIYDAALGAQGNEQSGKAILARQEQSQGGSFHYGDNLVRAIRFTGRILIDLIPKIYDTARVVRIVSETGDQKTVQINQQFMEGEVQKIYDLGAGKYDVIASAGPSYQSKRQEAVVSMIDLVEAFPQFMQVAGDLLVANMDFPGAREIAERLKTLLPPGLQQIGEGPLPPAAQQQIASLMQQGQQLQQQLQAAQQDLDQKISVKKIDADSRERIEAAKIRLDEMRIELDQKKLQTSIVLMQLKVGADRGDSDAQRLYDYLSQVMGQHHEAALTQMGHEHSLEQSQMQQSTQFDDGQ